MYAIIDIETTGSLSAYDRIIEIAVYIFNGKEITGQYATLINPLRPIPRHITALTGINNSMVAGAPTFEEAAHKIDNLTKDMIFVAHNVNFDYSFLQQEFYNQKINFYRKKLCTVRLSKKILPGFSSYSLGKICNHTGIKINDRHRAAGDAEATVKLLKILIDNDKENFIAQSLKKNSRESSLPPNLPREQFEALPYLTGVYYFFDNKGKVIYVGKGKNIRKRVTGHFLSGSDSRKKKDLVNNIFSVSFKLCDNENNALELENEEIKKYWPKYNVAQKNIVFQYGIYFYIDGRHYHRLAISAVKRGHQPLGRFNNFTEARNFLEEKVKEYNLCSKLCGLHKTRATCYDPLCAGACGGKEESCIYNLRLGMLAEEIRTKERAGHKIFIQKNIYPGNAIASFQSFATLF